MGARGSAATAAAIAILCLAVTAVLSIVVGPAQVFLLDRALAVDPADVPRRIEAELPCGRHCKVSGITLFEHSFTVSVLSEEVEGRNLVYDFGIADAKLGRSLDAPGGFYFDYREIDWSLATKLREDLNRMAIAGREVTDISIRPCTYSKKVPERACMEAKVLTARGDVSRTVDASTGELLAER
ncbi:MAG: hypothetical protein HOV80_18200 [Polyangiaceae bacterium]|nr:hypothetical protein [Polyangiaceae bacterium]